jgi:hypothetical protein
MSHIDETPKPTRRERRRRVLLRPAVPHPIPAL